LKKPAESERRSSFNYEEGGREGRPKSTQKASAYALKRSPLERGGTCPGGVKKEGDFKHAKGVNAGRRKGLGKELGRSRRGGVGAVNSMR